MRYLPSTDLARSIDDLAAETKHVMQPIQGNPLVWQAGVGWVINPDHPNAQTLIDSYGTEWLTCVQHPYLAHS